MWVKVHMQEDTRLVPSETNPVVRCIRKLRVRSQPHTRHMKVASGRQHLLLLRDGPRELTSEW